MIQCFNYANYYLGSKYRYTYSDGIIVEDVLNAIMYGGYLFGTDISINKSGDPNENDFEIENFRDPEKGTFQLILFDQKDMTKNQRKEYHALCNKAVDSSGDIMITTDNAFSLDFLFKNSFDVFDLLTRGNAINAKEYLGEILNSNPGVEGIAKQ